MAGGAAAGLATAILMKEPVVAVAVSGAIAAASALIPDIDHKNSHISHKLKPVGFVASTVFGHRKLLHSIIPYLCLYIAAILTFPAFTSIILSGLVGILSHLFLDMLNPEGVPLFYPFVKKRMSLAKIKTGSGGDTLVGVACLGACVFQALYSLRAAR